MGRSEEEQRQLLLILRESQFLLFPVAGDAKAPF